MATDNSGALLVLLLLGLILFAALAWCMVSSCLGRSFAEALRELWDTLILSAQSDTRPTQWRSRRNWDDSGELFELEHRGRAA
ncbi:hypothetical protein IEO21_02273 [Rhodonia placenta]|uniref:Uncharacterized protein n=2 Tax=Rhodonia placenta TaxID=104341 RepID=A0A1X6NEV8_9APHY|nr:hypothetical protein POSPLADRAFT_1037886 [Postia placenta MAD-698-R-SB12]KAF9819234.1 hypothetical protein IEO21_02273 [Postia placenta]OSX67169.1 hypothetical protein POSPLADRAFT_1037886 [Postia placenta MAD-698-R-SB12]